VKAARTRRLLAKPYGFTQQEIPISDGVSGDR
jgi:hypothetical protein